LTGFKTYRRGTRVNLEADVLTKLALKHFKSKISLKRRPKLIDNLHKAL
jgi:riboflavin synthase alpha subunit